MPLSASESARIADNLRLMVDGEAESRAQLANPPEWAVSLLGGASSASGIRVTPTNSLSISAVFAAVRNIAEDVAKLPLKVYRRVGDGKEAYPEHPLYPVLHDELNPEMTAMDGRTAVTGCALLFGNGYAEIVRNGMGQTAQLWPIENWRVQVKRDAQRRLTYVIDGSVNLDASEMFHIRSFNLTGVLGLMITDVGQDSLGLTLAAQRFASGFFARGAIPSGVITHPKLLSEPAQDRMRKQWMEKHSGENNGNMPALLQEGAAYAQVGVDPQKAQMLESRMFQIEDVARWFRIPPHKIGHLARSTNNNIEHQGMEYVTDTLMSWCVRWEQEGKRRLLSREERDVFIEHNMDALLRGDMLSRSQAMEIQSRNGVRSIDEWRSVENMNPLPDGMGKKHFVQLNMTPVELAVNAITPLDGQKPPAKPAASNPPATDDDGDEEDPKRAAMVRQLLAEGVGRCVRREVDVLRRASKKPDFEAFATSFFDSHRAYVTANIGTALALAGVEADEVTTRIRDYCARSLAGVSGCDALDATLDDWTTTKADTETRTLYGP